MKTAPSLLRQNTVSWLTLFTSAGTLICCALPILFVAGIQIPVSQHLNGSALRNDYILTTGFRLNF